MKKTRKNFIPAILALCILVIGAAAASDIVTASNQVALSAGMDYGDDVDTRIDAENASAAYTSAGYSTITITTPSLSQFVGSALNAKIWFLSGHGSSDAMYFGDLLIKCQSGGVLSNTLNIWNTVKHQDLITFAGCETAYSSDNITKRAVSQGASTAVGWTSTVKAASHTNWLKRYNDALSQGKTVSKAIESANSYLYLPGSGVKNVECYGNENLTITSARVSSIDKIYDSVEELSERDYNVLDEIRTLALSNKPEFETDTLVGYVYENNSGIIVDAYFKANRVITSAAVVLQLNKEGSLVGYKTYNMDSCTLFNISEQLSQISIPETSPAMRTIIAETEQNNIAPLEKVSSQTQFEYYDVESGQLLLITYTEVTDQFGGIYVSDNVTVIA